MEGSFPKPTTPRTLNERSIQLMPNALRSHCLVLGRSFRSNLFLDYVYVTIMSDAKVFHTALSMCNPKQQKFEYLRLRRQT